MKNLKREHIIIGIDADTTKIGVAVTNYKTGELLESHRLIPPTGLKFFERTLYLNEHIYELLVRLKNDYKIMLIGIEDYGAFFIQRIMAQKGEVIGIIKYIINKLNLRLFEYDVTKVKKRRNYSERLMVSPTKLKKFIFGKGNINKQGKSSRLSLICFQETGIDNISDDEVDAYYITLFLITILKYLKNNNKKYDDKFKIVVVNGGIKHETKLLKNRFDSFSDILNHFTY
jgi:hypothetical protein